MPPTLQEKRCLRTPSTHWEGNNCTAFKLQKRIYYDERRRSQKHFGSKSLLFGARKACFSPFPPLSMWSLANTLQSASKNLQSFNLDALQEDETSASSQEGIKKVRSLPQNSIPQNYQTKTTDEEETRSKEKQRLTTP